MARSGKKRAARTQKWMQRHAATVGVEESGDDGEVGGVIPGQPPLLASSMELAGAMAAPSPPLARRGGVYSNGEVRQSLTKSN
jgi:hypothetical protein